MTSALKPPVAGGNDRTPATGPRPPRPVTTEDRLAAVEQALAYIVDEWCKAGGKVPGPARPPCRPRLTPIRGGKS
jgi:hypothetical protein